MIKNCYIHKSAFVDHGAALGENSKVWHNSHIMSGASIGERCSLGQNVFVSSGAKIGDNVKIQNNVSIYDGVECEKDVFIGPSVVFTNVINPRSEISRKKEYQKTLIKRGATIGANSTIVCGVEIGNYSFIAAGSTISRDVPDFALTMGSSGKIVGWMSEYGSRLYFDLHGIAFCENSKSSYRYSCGIVERLD